MMTPSKIEKILNEEYPSKNENNFTLHVKSDEIAIYNSPESPASIAISLPRLTFQKEEDLMELVEALKKADEFLLKYQEISLQVVDKIMEELTKDSLVKYDVDGEEIYLYVPDDEIVLNVGIVYAGMSQKHFLEKGVPAIKKLIEKLK